MPSISNYALEDFANEFKLPLVSCCSKDRLPSKPIVGSYYINLADDNQPGTHWVYLRIFQNGDSCYMDSFGVPYPTNVGDFIKKCKNKMVNKRQIQNIDSTDCGFFVMACDVYFSHMADKRLPLDDQFEDFLSSFCDDTKLNDLLVEQILTGKTLK